MTDAERTELRQEIEAAIQDGDESRGRAVLSTFLAHLNSGELRAAEPDPEARHGWRVNRWVKRGILLGFRLGRIEETEVGGFRFADNDTYPLRQAPLSAGVRVVPGGSAVREGAFLGERVTCMPPMYVNVGAWVGEDSMIDSHALVGSCAQVGARCHISAAAQLGGVLEPIGALPVIIEDDVLVGGGSGVYEGVIVKRRAVIGAGVVLTGSTPVFDTVRGEALRAPLVIPEGAVVVPGSRPMRRGRGAEWGLHLQTPVIVKYRDEATDASTRIEELLR